MVCSTCGTALPTGAAPGLCPACREKTGSSDERDVKTVAGTPTFESPSTKPKAGPEVGRAYGAYHIHRMLGEGGMGAVYEAEHVESGRRLALKVLGRALDSPDSRKHFLREGRLAASINHPNCVFVYGTEEIDGAPVITMELVEGGTLRDRVVREGPLPVAEAVDKILQVVTGLEAAAAVGILHRDIKPSNCFIDRDGTVKVGDFGLSMAAAARGDAHATGVDSVVGTPTFASPEQLRGDELDVRSDIYSAGATLYYLLTGKTPHTGENIVKLIASVLERTPESPSRLRPEIPKTLARVVLRSLEKQREKRFRDYAELRAALMPFDSTAPTPAALGLRFAAGLLDHLVISLAPAIPLLVWMPDVDTASDPASFQHRGLWLVAFLGFLLRILYYAVPECIGGASLGKAICRLRVVDSARQVAGVGKTLLRAALFTIVPALPSILLFWIRPASAAEPGPAMLVGWSWYVLLALMFATARRANGFAGIHDLVSGTRVILKSAYRGRAAVPTAAEPVPETEGRPKIGPYVVLATLDKTDAHEILLGYDPRLSRRVWIRVLPAGAPPVGEEARDRTRAGRLRRLNGKRSPLECWDAYEAAPGRPLVAMRGEPQPWTQVRSWLLDLAEELRADVREGSLPPVLSLDRVWILPGGRAKLLDFIAPGASPTAPVATSGPVDCVAAQRFLHQAAVSALAMPVPLHARDFLEALRTLPTPELGVEALRAAQHRVATVSRGRRLALLAGCGLMPLLFGGCTTSAMAIMHRWSKEYPELPPLRNCLFRLSTLEKKSDAADERERRALEIYIAGRFRKTISNPAVWSSLYVRSSIPDEMRTRAERIIAEHPSPTEEEVREAGEVLAGFLRVNDPEDQFLIRPVWIALATLAMMGGTMALLVILPSLLAALLFKGGLLLRLLGLAIVNKDGTPASRGRVFWRSVVVWSPLLVIPLLLVLLRRIPDAGWFTLILPALWVIAAIFSVTRPGRSLQDRIAGTCLVPR